MIVKERGSTSLEDAFISYLEQAEGIDKDTEERRQPQPGGLAGPDHCVTRNIQAIRSRTTVGLCPARGSSSSYAIPSG